MSSRTLIAAAGLALMLGGACYEDEVVSPSPGRSLARVFLTDAPFPYDSVARVDIHVVRVEATEDADTTAGGDWVLIAEPRRTFDLLTLQQGSTALVGEGELPAGQYRAVRMTIDTGPSSIRWSNGAEATLNWQNYSGSTEMPLYAIVESPVDVPTSGASIVIDFDLGRSFLYDYFGTKEFTFLPWVRAVNEAATGVIKGTVTSDYTGSTQPIANANVTVYSGDPRTSFSWWVIATGRSDAQGRFTIAFVRAGTYAVGVEQPQYPFLAPETTTAAVRRGETTTVSVSLPEAGSGGAYIQISGPSSVGVGGTIALRVAVGDQSGNPVLNPSVSWTSSDATIAKVTGVGDTAGVEGRRPGFATIVAASGGLRDSLTIEVVGSPQPVAIVTVIPASRTLAVGDSSGFRAELRGAGGNVVTNRPVSWFSSDTTVVGIMGAFGEHVVVRARARGSATLRATSEGKVGEASVTVQ